MRIMYQLPTDIINIINFMAAPMLPDRLANEIKTQFCPKQNVHTELVLKIHGYLRYIELSDDNTIVIVDEVMFWRLSSILEKRDSLVEVYEITKDQCYEVYIGGVRLTATYPF